MSTTPYPNREQLETMYRNRDLYVAALLEKGEISTADLAGTDRLGRCRIASELWHICDSDSQERLLNDEHHFVRSCAIIAEMSTPR